MKTNNVYDNAPLCLCLGKTPNIRIMAFLIAHPEMDYTKAELARFTDMARQTAYKAVDDLHRFGLIVPNRRIANGTLYRLNVCETSDALILFNHLLVNVIIEEEKKKAQK